MPASDRARLDAFEYDVAGFPKLLPATSHAPFEELLHAIVALRPGSTGLPRARAERQRQTEDRGLVGDQLRFKAAVVDVGWADYVAGGRIGDVPKDQPGWLRRSARKLRRVLDPASTVLGSLSFIPGAGLIGEAVSCVGHALDFADTV